MDRLHARTVAILLGASALASCSTFYNAANLTGPQAEHAKAGDASFGAADSNLPTDLDGAIRRAQLLRTQGDLAGATRILSQLMLVAPDDARVVGEYGKVLTQEGRPRDAVDFLNRAVELQPGDWMLYSATGVAYDQLADPNAAKVAYERALALKPGEASVLNNYAMSRMLAGDLPGARTLIAQAANASSADPKIQRNLALVESMSHGHGDGPSSQAAPQVAIASATATRPPSPVAQNLNSRPWTTNGPVLMQDLPFDPAAPVARNANGRPWTSNGTVVMQDVPFDPLAGPISRAAHEPHKLAAVHAKTHKLAAGTLPKPKAKHIAKDETPRLRMTADALRP